MIYLFIGFILIAIAASILYYHEKKWKEVTFEFVGSFELDKDYRDQNGIPYKSSLRWYSLSAEPYSERGPEKQMTEIFSFDYEHYTYIVCMGYNLVQLKWQGILWGPKWSDYSLRRGFAYLGLDCSPRAANIYRIEKMWIEPDWKATSPNSNSTIVH